MRDISLMSLLVSLLLLALVMLFVSPVSAAILYGEQLVSQSPTEYWQFDEAAGASVATAQVSSPANDAAIPTSGVTTGVTATPQLRPADGFDGFSASNSWFEFLDNAASTVHSIPNISSSAEGSVSYWINGGAAGGTQMHYFGRPSSGGGEDFSGNVLHTWHNHDGRIGIFAAGADLRTSANFLSMGQWYHVAATWDRNTGSGDGKIHLYVDGAEIAKTSTGTWNNFDFSSHHRFGKGNTNNRPLNALADELAVWSSAIDSDQVLQQYGVGRTGTNVRQLIVNGDMEDNLLTGTGDFQQTPADSWIEDQPAGNTVGVIGETRSEVNDDIGDDIAWAFMQGTGSRIGQSLGPVDSLLDQPITISYQLTRRSNEGTDLNHILSLIAGTDITFIGGDVLATLTDTSSLTNNNYSKFFTEQLTPTGLTSNDTLWLVFERSATGQMMLDDVSAIAPLTAAVPEPSTLVLSILALLTLCCCHRCGKSIPRG